MRTPRHPFFSFLPLAALLLGGASGVRAEPALLTVGQGWAWVREFFPASDESDIDLIVWTNPPAQLDPDTLQVWNVRRPWPIREWRWLEAETPAPAAEAPAVEKAEDDPAEQPEETPAPEVKAEPAAEAPATEPAAAATPVETKPEAAPAAPKAAASKPAKSGKKAPKKGGKK